MRSDHDEVTIGDVALDFFMALLLAGFGGWSLAEGRWASTVLAFALAVLAVADGMHMTERLAKIRAFNTMQRRAERRVLHLFEE